jgi:hypothetical protein
MAPQRGFHVGGPISRLQLVRYVQAPTLAWPPIRAHPDLSSRAAGPYTPRNGRAVSHSNCGIATCPNRATDMPGLSPGRSWPYRPLHYPRGPRSGPSYAVSVHHHLFGPIRPTRRHIPISPTRLIRYALAVRYTVTPRRPATGSELSLAILYRHVVVRDPGRSTAAFTQFLRRGHWPSTRSEGLGIIQHSSHSDSREDPKFRGCTTVRFRYNLSIRLPFCRS